MADQGSGAWMEERRGKATASRIHDVVARTRTDTPYASYYDYQAELIYERISGTVFEHFVSKPMQWGIEHEDEAADYYEALTETLVFTSPFVPHPTIEMSGASPDRIVSVDGLVEFKCPEPKTHIKTLLTEEIDQKYYAQMQWQMECTDRQWCDFVSYDPRIEEPSLVMWIKRVQRDDEYLADARVKVVMFLDEIDEIVEKLRARRSE